MIIFPLFACWVRAMAQGIRRAGVSDDAYHGHAEKNLSG